ncbi:macrophage mannose receptor 1-like [Notolabrus celidotus]|uniref:macrophage mannose receptor 1-like n=1 Tax=Notolabrus celidotus TaxID=1203425 RepID=UPI00148FAA00|nr:macrophage mannose receptor 1-like [Notolabrus celidotus]
MPKAPQQYHLINSYLTWYEAQAFCRVKYTDLATIDNMNDNSQLVEALGGHVPYSWIGLHKASTRRWMWSDGRGEPQFRKWLEGEPSGHEWCAELSEKGEWNDLSCGEAKGYVCYGGGQNKYVYHSTAKNWFNSQQHCRSVHTDMAYINSDQDNSDVVNLFKTWHGGLVLEKKVWIGLFNDAWMWSDGGKNSFRNWLNNKEYRDNCAAVSSSYQGRWVDTPCNQKNTFVCQGGLKVKKMVMRMMVRSDVNLTDSVNSDALLKQFETRLKLQHLTDFTLSWRRGKDGLIFQRHEELEAKVETGC